MIYMPKCRENVQPELMMMMTGMMHISHNMIIEIWFRDKYQYDDLQFFCDLKNLTRMNSTSFVSLRKYKFIR